MLEAINSSGQVVWLCRRAIVHYPVFLVAARTLAGQADKRSIVGHHTRSRSLCPEQVTHLLDLRGVHQQF